MQLQRRADRDGKYVRHRHPVGHAHRIVDVQQRVQGNRGVVAEQHRRADAGAVDHALKIDTIAPERQRPGPALQARQVADRHGQHQRQKAPRDRSRHREQSTALRRLELEKFPQQIVRHDDAHIEDGCGESGRKIHAPGRDGRTRMAANRSNDGADQSCNRHGEGETRQDLGVCLAGRRADVADFADISDEEAAAGGDQEKPKHIAALRRLEAASARLTSANRGLGRELREPL